MPTYRIPFGVVTLPEGDYFELDTRIDRRPAGRASLGGRATAIRPRFAVAVSAR